ncbi:hypothetical protein LCGC14_1316670, partial [marine sediment metagenome]
MYNADTTIYMYYGNPNVASQEQPREVWDDDYAGVWHLKENGSASNYEDSTDNMNVGVGGSVTSNASPTQSTPPPVSNSVVGSSQDFDGTDDRVDGPTESYFNQVPFTTSAWAKFDTLPSAMGHHPWISGKVHNGSPYRSWALTGTPTTDKIRFPVTDSGGTDHNIQSNSVIVTGTWYYIVGTLDSSYDMKLYVNGVLQDQTTKAGSIYPADSELSIGERRGSGEHEGIIDEVRFSSVTRSADWIKTQYNMQFPDNQGAPVNISGEPDTVDNTKFIKKRGRQQRYYQYRRLITINKNEVEGTHTDFPVLINLTLGAGKARADGYDIIFTNMYGDKLDHEIESFNSSTGEVFAWVKIPTLSSLADTKLYIHYGNA